MKLVFEHRWEHALIAEIVARASEADDGYLGRTAMQKVLYFLQVLGVPMPYRFEIYHYGPFCSAILQDIDWLVEDGVIEDTSPEERYSNYKRGESFDDLRDKFGQQLDEYRTTIGNVVDALGGLDPNTLELIATLHFSFRWVKARGGEGPWKDLAIEKFMRTKKDKFSETQVREWYDVLIHSGLVEA